MKKAVFVDRDGTLNEMVYDPIHGTLDSPRRPEQVQLVKGAGAFLRGLRERGYFVVIATNQPGISKGTLTAPDLASVNDRLRDLVKAEGGDWDDLRICPHHPAFGSDCDCRKPKPGLLTAAARDHGIDLSQSWMIGDGTVDVQAGRAAGCHTILLTKLKLYHVERFFDMKDAEPEAVAGSLSQALAIISGGPRPGRLKE